MRACKNCKFAEHVREDVISKLKKDIEDLTDRIQVHHDLALETESKFRFLIDNPNFKKMLDYQYNLSIVMKEYTEAIEKVTCHRYPDDKMVLKDYWCGEFAHKEYQ